MIITITNQNGGAEKSFLAANLAASRALSGRRVLLVDSDPMQTSYRWSQRRSQARIHPAVTACSMVGHGLYPALEKLAGHYDDVVIDTERRDSLSSRSALVMAQTVILPIQPQWLKLADRDALIRRIEAARLFNPRLRILIVPACIPCEVSAGILAEIYALTESITAASMSTSIIHDGRTLREAFHEGRCVSEYWQRDANAIGEIASVYQDVFAAEPRPLLDRLWHAVTSAGAAGIPQPSR